MTFDLPNESCAGQREEVPDKGYSTGYFAHALARFESSELRSLDYLVLVVAEHSLSLISRNLGEPFDSGANVPVLLLETAG
jgi:hypothetical protein